MEVQVFQRVGRRIRGYRKRAGKTLEGLAEELGLSSGKYMGQIERGDANCTLATLIKIARGLGVQIEDFFPQDQDDLVADIIDVVRPLQQEKKEQILKVVKAMAE